MRNNTPTIDRSEFSRKLYSDMRSAFPFFPIRYKQKSDHGDHSILIEVDRIHEDAVYEAVIMALPELFSRDFLNSATFDSKLLLRKITPTLRAFLAVVNRGMINAIATGRVDIIHSEEDRAAFSRAFEIAETIEDDECPLSFPTLQGTPSQILFHGAIFAIFADCADMEEAERKCEAFAQKAAANYNDLARIYELPPLPGQPRRIEGASPADLS